MSDAMFIFCAILLLINGFHIGYEVASHRLQAKPREALQKSEPITEAEIERLRKEREEFQAEQKAFLGMMGYNADIAYGVGENPLGGD
jgi:hypothetical protein